MLKSTKRPGEKFYDYLVERMAMIPLLMMTSLWTIIIITKVNKLKVAHPNFEIITTINLVMTVLWIIGLVKALRGKKEDES